MKRKKLVQKHARKLFSVTASHTRKQNVMIFPVRGGIRL